MRRRALPSRSIPAGALHLTPQPAPAHPAQALGQCAAWLDAHLPRAARLPASSTSAAALLASTSPRSAAIASAACLALHHTLRACQDDIADRPDNRTRFLLLRPTSCPEALVVPAACMDVQTRARRRLLLSFHPHAHILGSLCRALHVFGSHGMHVRKLDTRPTRLRPWEYTVWVELEHADAPEASLPSEPPGEPSILEQMVAELERHASHVRVYGTFAPLAGG
jgi:prephenate dehydratase